MVLEPTSCTAPLELEVESWGPLGHCQSAFSADIHPQLACCFPGVFNPGPTWLSILPLGSYICSKDSCSGCSRNQLSALR